METAIAAAAGATIVEEATTTTLKAGEGLFEYLYRQINYVKNIKKNFEKLEKEVNDLNIRKKDVEREIEAATRVLESPTEECKGWLEEVTKTMEKVKNLKDKYEQTAKCLCGCCPFWILFELGKKMEKMTMEVQGLITKGKLENGILIRSAPMRIQKKQVQKILVPLHEDVLNKILEHLRDEGIKKIGIWGQQGVGKTTILKTLNDMTEISKMFDIVIWLDVSDNPSVSEMQKEVIQRLNLNAQGIDSAPQLSVIISEKLKLMKYLVLLDQVYSVVNLHEVGIRDDHEGGRVILAARFRHICVEFYTDEDIHVDRLSIADAWKLFKEYVGEIKFKPLAEQIVDECGLLPQLISTVARTLKKEKKREKWVYTLAELQSPTSRIEHREEVRKAFLLGYMQLNDRDRKNCLLYGALYPEDHEIHRDHLIECWRAERFIDPQQKLRETRERTGYGILEDLTDRCLLESGKKVKYVKMPGLYRRLVLSNTLPDEESDKVLVRSGLETQNPPGEEEWEQVKRVSLINNQPCPLPESPNCSILSTLLLHKDSISIPIPELFFSHMCTLQVLDLYGTEIKSLPSSLSNLQNLRGLYLNVCKHLGKLPSQISVLKNLEILDIRHTAIIDLPIEIKELTSLRCLRVSFTNVGNHNHIHQQSKNAMIPQNVISNLSLLEELSIIVDPPHDQRWNQIVDIVAEEVASLEELSTLHFYFPTLDCFKEFIKRSKSWNKNGGSNYFRSFNFSIGPHNGIQSHGFEDFEILTERSLRFSSCTTIPESILKVLPHAGVFELVNHQCIQDFSEFGMENMEGLNFCLIEGCNLMKSFIRSDMATNNALRFLKKLKISNLPELESIWEGSVKSGSLYNLTTLVLNGCPKLKKIFSEDIILQLSHLQMLQVEDCSIIEEIITEVDSQILEIEDLSNALPKLKTLELLNLPKLYSICHDAQLDWPSLERLKISECDELKILPFRMESATRIRVIEGEDDWWNNLQWEDSAVKDRFHQIRLRS